MQIVMRIFTPSAAKELLLSPADVRRSDPRTGDEVKEGGFGFVSVCCFCFWGRTMFAVGFLIIAALSVGGVRGRCAGRTVPTLWVGDTALMTHIF